MALYTCPRYDSDSFLATQTKFTAVYGETEKCYADHGTHILAGAKKAGKHYRKRSQKDTVGVHSHGVQLEKRSKRSNDKFSKAHPGPKTRKRGEEHGLP